MAKQAGSKKGTGAKKATKAAKTSEPQDEYTAQPEAAPAEVPAPVKAKREPAPADAKAEPKNGPTLYEVSEGYLAFLDKDGAGDGTIASYGMEMKLAMRELGDNTPVADLTVERVREYFESKAVTRTRTNKPKAKPTVDKTRRVLRLALLWAVDEKLLAVAPIPETKPAKLKAV